MTMAHLVLTITRLIEMLTSDLDGSRTAHVHAIHIVVEAEETCFETLY